jgi:hypothetical protein
MHPLEKLMTTYKHIIMFYAFYKSFFHFVTFSFVVFSQ